MANVADQCPFLMPVMADALWMWPVPAYCRRPDVPLKVPARGTVIGMCATREHARCPGFRTSEKPAATVSAIRPTSGPRPHPGA
jgi:hypothetical protein